jgi:hypothetical protein
MGELRAFQMRVRSSSNSSAAARKRSRKTVMTSLCGQPGKGHFKRGDRVNLVSRVTREAVAEAITAISRRGAERQAETSAIAVRGMFKWLGGDAQRARYGVAQDLLRGLRAPERSMDESDAGGALHVPDGEEIGRIVGWLTTSNAPERNRLAGRLLVYTVQRRRDIRRDGGACLHGRPKKLTPPAGYTPKDG